MKHTGVVYKFLGKTGLIRPKEYGISRKDVLFKKTEHNLKLGDKVKYEFYEKNGRRYAFNLEKE